MPLPPHPLTTLLVVWPWPDPPPVETCRSLLEAHGSVASFPLPARAPEGTPPEASWAVALDVPGVREPIYVWPTPAEPLSLAVVAEMLDAPARDRRRFHRARWHLALHQLLDPADPAAAYHRLLKLALALCPELPALYDAESLLLRPAEAVRRLAAHAAPPAAHELYRIHAVVPDAELDDAGPPHGHAWLHTHGLERAGLPEVELNQVPRELAVPGGKLINLLAACCLGDPDALADEVRLEVVRGHPVRARSLEALGPDVYPPPGDPVRGLGHGGRRVAVVDPGRGRGPPLACLEAIAAGAAVTAGSEREARRSARRARDGWPEFGMAFATHRTEPGYEFLVQLAYPAKPGRSEEHEHLWFEVLDIAPGRVRARLLCEPVAVSGMAQGDVGWHDLARLSDWSIHRPNGVLSARDV